MLIGKPLLPSTRYLVEPGQFAILHLLYLLCTLAKGKFSFQTYSCSFTLPFASERGRTRWCDAAGFFSFRLCRRETLHTQTAYIAIIKVGIKQSEIHLLKRAMLVVFMVMNRICVFLTLYEDDPRILYQSNRVSLAR